MTIGACKYNKNMTHRKNILIEGNTFIKQLIRKRKIILELVKRELKIKYSANYLGLTWALLEPVAMMMILWLVFTYMRSGPSEGYPFAPYLLCGVMAFNFFNGAIGEATKSIISFSFIMKLGNFRLAILPLVKITAALAIHLMVIGVAIIIFLFSGVKPSWYWFQMIYYLIATWVLLAGIGWASSALVLFYPDVQYIINITMRTIFFLTPIFWNVKMFPEHIAPYLKINPLFHIVEGYRNCFIYQKPFWEDKLSLILFWSVTLFLLILGITVFRKLRPYFADVVK